MAEAWPGRARRAGAAGALVAALLAVGCSSSTPGATTSSASASSGPPASAAPSSAVPGTAAAPPGTTRGSGTPGTQGTTGAQGTQGTKGAPGTTGGRTSPSASTAALVAAACDKSLERGEAGTVRAPALNEVSGVAASTTNPGVLWVHNDSGDSPRTFAVGPSGAVLGTYTLTGATAQDWEDMAIGPGVVPGEQALYFGDIGDNKEDRASITVFRVREPKVDPATPVGTVALDGVDTLTLTYPDGAHNAETLLVDTDGAIYVLTKKAGSSTIYRAPPGLADGSTTELAAEGTVPLEPAGLLTGGAIAPAGDAVVLRTYGEVYLYRREPGSTIAATLAGARCIGDLAKEPQGEAVTFAADGASYVTMSEGVDQPINTYGAP